MNSVFVNPGIYSCAVDAFQSFLFLTLNVFWQISSSPPRAANRINGSGGKFNESYY